MRWDEGMREEMDRTGELSSRLVSSAEPMDRKTDERTEDLRPGCHGFSYIDLNTRRSHANVARMGGSARRSVPTDELEWVGRAWISLPFPITSTALRRELVEINAYSRVEMRRTSTNSGTSLNRSDIVSSCACAQGGREGRVGARWVDCRTCHWR